MSINDKITKVLYSPMLATSLFLGTGLTKTYKDYKQADEKFKNKFLIKDTVVLSGAMAGMAVAGNIHLLTKHTKPVKKAVDKLANNIKDKLLVDKFTKNAIDNKYVQNSFNYAKEIVNSTFLNCSLFVFGISGAVAADTALTKFYFKKLDKTTKNEKETEDDRLGVIKFFDEQMDKYVGEENKKTIYARACDMPQLSMLSPSIIGEESLKISNETDTKKKLKHTTSALINKSLIPMFLLSASTILTHKMNSWLRIPTIFLSLIFGTKGVDLLRKSYLDKKQS